MFSNGYWSCWEFSYVFDQKSIFSKFIFLNLKITSGTTFPKRTSWTSICILFVRLNISSMFQNGHWFSREFTIKKLTVLKTIFSISYHFICDHVADYIKWPWTLPLHIVWYRSCRDEKEGEIVPHLLATCPTLCQRRRKYLSNYYIDDLEELLRIDIGSLNRYIRSSE